jgi:hypothetical protein
VGVIYLFPHLVTVRMAVALMSVLSVVLTVLSLTLVNTHITDVGTHVYIGIDMDVKTTYDLERALGINFCGAYIARDIVGGSVCNISKCSHFYNRCCFSCEDLELCIEENTFRHCVHLCMYAISTVRKLDTRCLVNPQFSKSSR